MLTNQEILATSVQKTGPYTTWLHTNTNGQQRAKIVTKTREQMCIQIVVTKTELIMHETKVNTYVTCKSYIQKKRVWF